MIHHDIIYKIPVIITGRVTATRIRNEFIGQAIDMFGKDPINEEDIHTEDIRDIRADPDRYFEITDAINEYIRNGEGRTKKIIFICCNDELRKDIRYGLIDLGITCYTYDEYYKNENEIEKASLGILNMYMPIYGHDKHTDYFSTDLSDKNMLLDTKYVYANPNSMKSMPIEILDGINQLTKIYDIVLNIYHYADHDKQEACFAKMRDMMYKICTVLGQDAVKNHPEMYFVMRSILGSIPMSYIYFVCSFIAKDDPITLMDICGFMEDITGKSE